MNIVVIGRGNVGGGLAALWRKAGHEVTELSRRGGDASGADVIVVPVPRSAGQQPQQPASSRGQNWRADELRW